MAASSSGYSGPTNTKDGVDTTPLQPSLNKNKESLKLKLQNRRPINALIDQGILPAPHTPPTYALQRVKLERAKTGDLLKAKIQQRPSRLDLVNQHILQETDSRVAPLLQEKQRMLKRARLADSLNDHLIHRPGPLELVQKNILHAGDLEVDAAIRDGHLHFKATNLGATPGPPLPTKYICTEEDSSSSDLSNLETLSVPVPVSVVVQQTTPLFVPLFYQQNLEKSLKSKSKSKKGKGGKKFQIKFHEYKGPPSAVQMKNSNEVKLESSYELLLQQQQLFLQWQLEHGNRFPKLLHPLLITEEKPPIINAKNEMKVNELKLELKKRSLPVSGSKQQLVERLKQFQESSRINLKNESLQLKIEKLKENEESKSTTFENCLKDLMEDSSFPIGQVQSFALVSGGQSAFPLREGIEEKDPHLRSQMVDDVLEILIRNGELPASDQIPPPPPLPPPLPPTSFSITLPTEIGFKKNCETRKSVNEDEEMEMDNNLFNSCNTNLELPMESEYSDWLESFSADNNFCFSKIENNDTLVNKLDLGSNNNNNNNGMDVFLGFSE